MNNTPLSYRQWLQLKANDSTPTNAWDRDMSNILLNIVGDDGKLDANAVAQNRQFTDSSGATYSTAGSEGDFANPGKGLMDVNAALVSRYNNYMNSPELISQFNQQNQGYVSGGGVGSGSGTPLNQIAIDAINSKLAQLDPLYEQDKARQLKEFSNLQSQFDSERDQNQAQYDERSLTNQQNYNKNLMQSLYGGIDGLQGLMSILRGQGAQYGSARDMVGRAVEGQTTRDITQGADTRNENQTALDAALSAFTNQDENRRRQAEATRDNNLQALQANRLTSQRDAYNQLAEVYGAAGNTAQAQKYAADAVGLDPRITSLARTNVADYSPFQSISQTPDLTAFAGPSSPGAISAGGGQGNLGSGIFTLGDFRRRQAQGA